MLNKIIDLIQSPGKSLITVISGTATGYVPDLLSVILRISESKIDIYFQQSVWLITIVVGITATISWVQKQRDRYKSRRKKK